MERSTRAKHPAPSVTKTEVPSTTNEPSPREVETSVAPGGKSSGTELIVPGSEGLSTSSGGSPSDTAGTSSGAGGPATGTKGGSTGSEKDPVSGIEIPAYVIDAAGFRSSFDEGNIYPEIDFYILYGVDKQIGIPVPGTEVCIEGDQLRTKERMTITEVKTDYSRCRYFEVPGDDEPPKITCPPEAETRIVHFNAYASSPLVYSVRTCLEYDQSHCYDSRPGDEGESEVCRVDFQYEGIWAEGTIFAYKCTKSEAHTYRHPLQYTIRYMVNPDADSDRGNFRAREVYREDVPVKKCDN